MIIAMGTQPSVSGSSPVLSGRVSSWRKHLQHTGRGTPRVPRGRFARILLGIGLLLIAGYGAGGWYLWANQRELIFTPTHEELGTPADLHLEYEDVWLPVGDGTATSLHGWWLRADSPVAPTVLYLH